MQTVKVLLPQQLREIAGFRIGIKDLDRAVAKAIGVAMRKRFYSNVV